MNALTFECMPDGALVVSGPALESFRDDLIEILATVRLDVLESYAMARRYEDDARAAELLGVLREDAVLVLSSDDAQDAGRELADVGGEAVLAGAA